MKDLVREHFSSISFRIDVSGNFYNPITMEIALRSDWDRNSVCWPLMTVGWFNGAWRSKSRSLFVSRGGYAPGSELTSAFDDCDGGDPSNQRQEVVHTETRSCWIFRETTTEKKEENISKKNTRVMMNSCGSEVW